MKPFSEVSLFEQGNAGDLFYSTGSNGSLGETPGTFSKSLFSKDQVRLTFSVNSGTTMLPNSSSMYYFNVKNGNWNIPSNAIGEHKGIFQNYAFNTNFSPRSGSVGTGGTLGTLFLEDYKCFDPYGRSMASGSLDIYRQALNYNQTVEGIENLYTLSNSNIIPFLLNDYPKSCQRSSIYEASSQETFDLGLDKPFLIEKVVFEIPFKFGSTWFKDITSTILAETSGTYAGTQQTSRNYYYDRGGPAITVSLFCQKKYGIDKVRDLVTSGTITHKVDKAGDVRARLYGLSYTEGNSNLPIMLIEAAGFKSPSVTIDPQSNSQYTGSVVVKTTPAISNGASAIFSRTYFVTGTMPNIPPEVEAPFAPYIFSNTRFLSKMSSLLQTKEINLIENDYLIGNWINGYQFQVTSIDPFGRAMTGFSPSGGSIFGGEYTTSQLGTRNNPKFTNPFFLESSTKVQEVVSQISSKITQIQTTYDYSPSPDTVWATIIGDSDVFMSNKASPYLLNPGDKLVLAVSKTRPAVVDSYHDVPNSSAADIGYQNLRSYTPYTGSLSGHDVQFDTGSINITFYGSYVRAGNSYTP